MHYVLEFGIRGGAHTDNVIVPTLKLGVRLACSLVHVFTNDPCHPAGRPENWWIGSKAHGRRTDRESWQSATHFVALSKLGRTDGSAASKLWKPEA